MEPGVTKSMQFATSDRDSAAAIGNVGVAVVSSVALIAMVEECCGQLLTSYLEAGEASVGTEVKVTHHNAVPLRESVRTQARVIGTERRAVTFAVACYHGERLIMDGTHERVVVDLQRFLARLEGARA